MKKILLDTNILLLFLRDDMRWKLLFKQYDLENSINCLSIISLGELYAIGLRNKWSPRRLVQIDNIQMDFTMLDIDYPDLIVRYGELDAYSQGKLEGHPLSLSARNMGKNDLWIAATASTLGLELLTTDNDFNHLDPTFLKLIKV
jgi:predicted nucleic acid-binding protein